MLIQYEYIPWFKFKWFAIDECPNSAKYEAVSKQLRAKLTD